jgi:hypothetical protein
MASIAKKCNTDVRWNLSARIYNPITMRIKHTKNGCFAIPPKINLCAEIIGQYSESLSSHTRKKKSEFMCTEGKVRICVTCGYPWGLTGYRARRRETDSRGPVLVAGLSLNK